MKGNLYGSLGCFLGLLFLTGCITNYSNWVKAKGGALDDVAEGLEEYGSISLSRIVLSPVGDERFNFDLVDVNAKEYYDHARDEVQGGAASFQQVSQALGLGIAVQQDPTVAAAYSDQLRQFQLDRARQQEIRDLQDSAARNEYLDAVEKAMQETDSETRAKKLAEAKRAYSKALTQPSSDDPTFPTAATDGSDTPDAPSGLATPPDEARKPLAGDQKFAGFMGLLDGLGTKEKIRVNDRSALITAAGNNAVEAIFKVLGDPADAEQFEDKSVLFGVAMVSVNPGWRTQEGFAADLAVQVKLGLRPARTRTVKMFVEDTEISSEIRKRVKQDYSLSNSNGLAGALIPNIPEHLEPPRLEKELPIVAAISPMTDVQTLDLGSSMRRRSELSISLSYALRAAGLGAQAEAFQQFVKQQETDVLTRTPAVPVNAYSDGALFGYQIGPTLQGIDTSSLSKKPKPVNRLSRQSFPVLLMFGLDSADLAYYVVCVDANGERVNCNDAVANTSRLWVVEPYLELVQTPRWIPLSKKASRHRLSETTRLAWSERLAKYCESADQSPASSKSGKLGGVGKGVATDCSDGAPDGTKVLANYRESMLKRLAFGSSLHYPFPQKLMHAP